MRTLLLSLAMIVSLLAWSQEAKKFDIYKPAEDANTALTNVIAKAGSEDKHVLIQIGGNWCSWCARFYKFGKEDVQIDSLMKSSFVVYHLNYSKENKNLPLLAKYSFPQRFGFPVFLVLDGKGNLLHTQNSAYLEQDKGYGKEKVMEFLSSWTKQALDPEKYK